MFRQTTGGAHLVAGQFVPAVLDLPSPPERSLKLIGTVGVLWHYGLLSPVRVPTYALQAVAQARGYSPKLLPARRPPVRLAPLFRAYACG